MTHIKNANIINGAPLIYFNLQSITIDTWLEYTALIQQVFRCFLLTSKKLSLSIR